MLEDDILFNNFLERGFFKRWKNITSKELVNYSSLELIINGNCDLKCKYCYIKEHREGLFTKESEDSRNIIRNFRILLSWLSKNSMQPNISLFGGEVLSQNIGIEILEELINWAPPNQNIIIPTNMNFLLGANKNYILDLIKRGKERKVSVHLSASVDGIYMEGNRPFKNTKNIRNEEFYNQLFICSKEYKFGFHPMVYFDNIDKWIDNFLWFQENFEKYNLPWSNLYLLEVRNKDWTKEQCKGLEKFINFLVKWSWDKCERDVNKFLYFIYNNRGFNILNSWMTTLGRGIGCSIQGDVQLRLGDLAIVNCHRLSYEHTIAGRFKVENNKIMDVEAENFELYLAIHSMNGKCMPGCETCVIKELCGLGCLGSQYEATGDHFSPIPTVCRMEHYKIKALIEAFIEIDVLQHLVVRISENKRSAIKLFMEELI